MVITNCTNRKRLAAAPEVRLAFANGCVRTWSALVGKATPRLPARAMYCGRGFREAECAAAAFSGDLWIASAGLGFVCASTPIPAYGATAVPGHPDSIPGDPAEWFTSLVAYGPFPAEPNTSSAPLVLASLSSHYLAMLTPWLLDFVVRRPGRLRLFTRAALPSLPRALQDAVMPYDQRFDDPVLGCSGTIGDFAQRALRDFTEAVLPADPGGGVGSHAEAVARRLENCTVPLRRVGRGATDAELRALIRDHWHTADGRSGKMLRVLRDDLGVACEQGRFKKLFNGVAVEMEVRA